MKNKYVIFFVMMLTVGVMMAQEQQKNFINYQGVSRNGAAQLMANETMIIGIALKMGSSTGAATYAENHSVVTDANGVFSIKIGNGDAVSGEYNTIPWGSEATFITVLMNGSEIGTTEMMAVPYALSSGDGAQQADEVPYDNSVSGLTATNTQQAIDELLGSGAVDADADPANELQDISLSGTDLSISDGSTIDLSAIVPPGGTDDQNAAEVPFDNTASGLVAADTQSAIDELATSGVVDTDDQDLSLSGTTLQITDGASVDLSPIIPLGGTDDQNAAEVPFDNTASGLTATDAQAAIDELVTGGGSSLWTANGNSIYYNTNGGNVGIGTTTPISPLEIVTGLNDMMRLESTNSTGDGWIRFNNSTGRVGYAGMFNGTRDIEFGTSGSNPTGKVHLTINADPKLTVATNGAVGVGTTNPESKLHVAGNFFVQSDLGSLDIGFPNNGSRWKLATIDSGANLIFRSKPNGTTTPTTRFRMFQNGEFQMGANGSPSAWMHIRNNSTVTKPHIKIVETENDYARLELSRSQSSAFWHVAGLANNSAANSRLNFFYQNNNSASDRMTITGDGKVGINGVPQARLHIYQRGQGSNDGLRFSDGTTNLDWDIIHRSNLWFVYGGNPRAGIHRLTGAYVQASDRRLKTNIANLRPVLDRVNQLRAVTYHFKSDSSNKNILGLIAQEVQPLFPELVSSSGEDEMLALDYSAFSVVAIKAIQEQQKIIQSLQNEQDSMQSQFATLKAQIVQLVNLQDKKDPSLKE